MARPWHTVYLVAVAFGAAGSLAMGVACGGGSFACVADGDCIGGGPGGLCEPQGWCSFADPACPTGQRFGDRAGDGLGGDCVPSTDGTGGTGGSAPSSSGEDTQATSDATTLTTDPTIATLEGGIDSSGGGSSGSDTDPAKCGDGTIDPGEECDDVEGNGVGGPCRADCRLNVCGDGYIGPGETCDGGPDCSVLCQDPVCGNGVLEPGEECDFDGADIMPCASLGYVSGDYDCSACELDVDECVGCGPDGCDYGACMGDGDCEDGQQCVDVENRFCTAPCESDDDCTGDLEQVCIDVDLPTLICLPVCQDGGGCPQGLDCFAQVMPAVCL